MMNKLTSIFGIVFCTVLLQIASVEDAHAREPWSWHCDREPVQNFWEGTDVFGGNELSGRGSICGFVDFGGDDPLGVFGRMDSVVPHRAGHIRFGGVTY